MDRRTAQFLVREFLAREVFDHPRSADEGVGLGDHDHYVGQAQQEGRAGDGGAGHAEHHRYEAGAGHEFSGCNSPSVNRGHSLVDRRT